jgi:hypothetical protein
VTMKMNHGVVCAARSDVAQDAAYAKTGSVNLVHVRVAQMYALRPFVVHVTMTAFRTWYATSAANVRVCTATALAFTTNATNRTVTEHSLIASNMVVFFAVSHKHHGSN